MDDSDDEIIYDTDYEVEESDDNTSSAENVPWHDSRRWSIYEPEKYLFIGNSTYPESFSELDDPLSYFRYFLNNEILDVIVRESNQYAAEKKDGNDLKLTRNELLKFIGSVL